MNIPSKIKSEIYSHFIKLRNLFSKGSLDYFKKESLFLYFQDFNSNWGDAVNPWIFEELTNKKVVSAKQIYNFRNKPKFYGIGSILNSNLENTIIWGSGFIKPPLKITGIPVKILAVRGELSGKILDENGIKHDRVYGDPALLMPGIYNPLVKKKYKLGIIPHYTELIEISSLNKFDNSITIISPLVENQNYMDIIDQIKECENILSSSLHGLILADAYGVPSLRLKFRDKIIGGDFKFDDYYSGVNIQNHKKYNLTEINKFDFEEVLKNMELKNIKFDSDRLKNSLLNYLKHKNHNL